MTGVAGLLPWRYRDAGLPVLRRRTDRYMAVGFVGFALFAWIVVVRQGLVDNWDVAALYAAPASLITYAAVGMVRLLFKRWGRIPPLG